jgi:hypothetical protein
VFDAIRDVRRQDSLRSFCVALQRTFKKRLVLRGRLFAAIPKGDHLVAKILVEDQGVRVHEDA